MGIYQEQLQSAEAEEREAMLNFCAAESALM